jgi:predicted N-acetyltransferase YhbS
MGHPPPRKPDADERVRASQALERRLTGATYKQIAAELGYSSEAGPRNAIDRMLTRRESANVAALREVEGDRLDQLMRAHWDAAVSGDVDATKVVLSVIDRRMKLFGLAAPVAVDVSHDVSGLDGAVFVEAVRSRALALVEANTAGRPAPVIPATIDAEVIA